MTDDERIKRDLVYDRFVARFITSGIEQVIDLELVRAFTRFRDRRTICDDTALWRDHPPADSAAGAATR